MLGSSEGGGFAAWAALPDKKGIHVMRSPNCWTTRSQGDRRKTLLIRMIAESGCV